MTYTDAIEDCIKVCREWIAEYKEMHRKAMTKEHSIQFLLCQKACENVLESIDDLRERTNDRIEVTND